MKTGVKLIQADPLHLALIQRHQERLKIGTVSKTVLRLLEDYDRMFVDYEQLVEQHSAIMHCIAERHRLISRIAELQTDLDSVDADLTAWFKIWTAHKTLARLDSSEG